MKKSLGLLSFAFFATVSSIVFYKKLDTPYDGDKQELYFPAGMHLSDIGQELQQKGLIPYKALFYFYFLFHPHHLSLKSGEYLFEKGETPAQILRKIFEGKCIVYKLSIPEGWTSLEIVERLNSIEKLEGNIPNVPLEGTLFPSTYYYKRGQRKEFLLSKMEKKMKRLLESFQKRFPSENLNEKLIMASLIEKEAFKSPEKPRIASVFYNRLKRGMKLQCDPTVIYGANKGKFIGYSSVTKEHLQMDTPFNSYLYKGLPPTPICNPGKEALDAAFNPLATKDLYFVVKGNGEHEFNEHFSLHQKAVTRLRQMEQGVRNK